jgi:hypothetical protein
VFEEMLPAPPATAAIESTKRILLLLGMFPSLSIRPASVPIAVTVPTVSKKSESRRVKTKRTAATIVTPSKLNAHSRSNSPKSEKSGVATMLSGTAGTLSPHPFGFV